MTLLLTLALIALPAAGLFTLYALVRALVVGGHRAVPTMLAGTGAGFVAIWLVRAYQLGVEADATGSRGNVFDQLWWLVAGVGLAGASLVASHRSAAPS